MAGIIPPFESGSVLHASSHDHWKCVGGRGMPRRYCVRLRFSHDRDSNHCFEPNHSVSSPHDEEAILVETTTMPCSGPFVPFLQKCIDYNAAYQQSALGPASGFLERATTKWESSYPSNFPSLPIIKSSKLLLFYCNYTLARRLASLAYPC